MKKLFFLPLFKFYVLSFTFFVLSFTFYVLSFTFAAQAATFSDITSPTLRTQVEFLSEKGIIKVIVEKSEDKFWPGEFQIAVIKNSNGMTLSKWVQNIRIEDVSGGDLITERENDTIAFRSSKLYRLIESSDSFGMSSI